MAKNKTVYINGYYLSDGKEFEDYKCIIGEWDEDNDEDDDIFFYFTSLKELKEFMKVPSLGNDFVVTSYRIEEDNNE